MVERYAVYDEIASGGMASVHFARLFGPLGFSRIVAVKKLHPTFAKDPQFVAMLLDEARLAARVRHPNVVTVQDVVTDAGEILLVMDYVAGEPLSKLLVEGERPPPAIAASVIVGTLHGLHAAHEATDERGVAMDIVHRDVSPQNVLVGTDGVARVVDFGVAKAAVRSQVTRDGQVKGKMPYMAPEQLRGGTVDRRVDLYAAGVVLWEMLAGRRLFVADSDAAMFAQVLDRVAPPPGVSPAIDELVLRALARNPGERFATAWEMARAIEQVIPPASAAEVGAWVQVRAGQVLEARSKRITEIETDAVTRPFSVRRSRDDEPTMPAGRPRRAGLVIAVGALATAAVMGWGWLSLRAPEPPTVVAPQPAPEPAAVIAPEPSPTPAPVAKPTPPAIRVAKQRSRRVAPRPAECYQMGADGILHVKPECLSDSIKR